MQRESNAQRVAQRPRLTVQRDVYGCRCCHPGAGLREDRKPAVTLAPRPDDYSAVFRDNSLNQRIVADHCRSHGV
jgi:hypothetical protein